MKISEEKQFIYKALYNSLRLVYKNDFNVFSTETGKVLENASNPFELFCLCVLSDKDYFQNQTNSFLCHFVLEFEAFVLKKKDKLNELLTEDIQLEAFNIFKDLKYVALQDALTRCFSLTSITHLILPLLVKELKPGSNSIQYTINLLIKLKSPSKLILNGIVIPLFLQNKIAAVEKFLTDIPSLQLEFMEVLDGIVGGKIEILDLLELSDMKEFKGDKSPKTLFKLGLRLMKKYNIDPEKCPNIFIRHKLSSARYLFHKHYFYNDLTLESLIMFAKEISGEILSLQIDILDLFVEYNDCISAINFMNDKNIPKECIPNHIHMHLTDKMTLKKAQDMRNDRLYKQKLNANDFFSLPIQIKIKEIKTSEAFKKAIKEIKSLNVIGIDTESQPALFFNQEESLMLLQIASFDCVYLFDMLSLKSELLSDDFDQLGHLFSNPDIKKLTYSPIGDIKCLREFHSKLENQLKNITNMIDLHLLKQALLDHCPDIFPYLDKKTSIDHGHKGLSELVYLCFGKPLNKREQCSFWSARPLSHDQIVYAALDAFCLISIFDFAKAKESQFPYVADYFKHLQTSGVLKQQSNMKKSVPKKKPKKKKKNKNFIQTIPQKGPKQNTGIFASSFKVTCDSMLQGLGKQMRYCNIDAAIIGTNEFHDKCVHLYEKENRIILTRGTVYHTLRKHVPASHIMSIQNDDVHLQLEEVIKEFGVIIRESDIFARCGECNSPAFHFVSPELLSQMKRCKDSGFAAQWVSIDGGRHHVDAHNGITSNGTMIKHEDIPDGVLNKISVAYVCRLCGKCFWDGSHRQKMKKNLSHLIQQSVVRIPVPPPSPLAM